MDLAYKNLPKSYTISDSLIFGYYAKLFEYRRIVTAYYKLSIFNKFRRALIANYGSRLFYTYKFNM